MKYFVALFISAFSVTPTHASTLVNGYTVMSEQEAYNWVVETEAERARAQVRPPRAIVPLTDARYAEVKRTLAMIWQGYKKTYPRETRGLSSPVPVLIEDASVNAYALYRKDTQQIPFLFVIHTSTLKDSQEQRLGLYAHELGHLVTKNLVPEVAKRMAKYYFVDGREEPLGLLQKNDPTIQAYAERHVTLAETVGPLARRSLNGVVLDITGTADYGLLQKYLISTYMDAQQKTKPECQTAADLKQQAVTLIGQGFSPTTLTLTLPPEANATLSEITRKFNAAMEDCIGPVKPDLLSLQAARTGTAVEKLEKLIPAEDVAIFNSAPTIWQGILAITVPREAEFEDIAQTHDLTRTRIYTFEENADEAAARALRAMGRSSSDLASFLFSAMTPIDADQCRATIAAGQVPSYGPLFDPHHGTCYRVYHLQAFEKYLRK